MSSSSTSTYGIINGPLLHIQVTRLVRGGFVMAVRQNYVYAMADAQGLVQFLEAVHVLARRAAIVAAAGAAGVGSPELPAPRVR
ncbi:unnamed protein product [Urochloa humidicola]